MAGALSLLNSPIATMAIVFGTIQALRLVDMTNPKTVLVLRGTYILSQMSMLLFWYYIRSKAIASAKKNEEMVEIEEPGTPFSGEAAKKKKMTVSEYDSQEARKQMQQVVIGCIIMLVLHVWLGMVQALVLQVILPWKALLTQPLVQIYIFGFAATGALKRPFKQANPLSEFMNEQTSEASGDKAAEKETPRITEIKDEDDQSDASSVKSTSSSTKNKKKASRKED